MVAAAQRGALPAVDPFLARIHLEPQLIDETRNRRALRAEIGNPPGMNDILRRQEQAHFGTAGNDQGLVDLQQIVRHRFGIDAGIYLAREIRIPCQGGEEIHALRRVHVGVLPFPLVTGDADGQLGIAGIFLLEDEIGGGDGHDHQNHHRNDGPDDFHLGAVKHGGVGHRALRVAEFDQGINHRAEDEDRDADTDPKDLHVQAVHVAGQVGHAGGQVVAVRGVGAGVGGQP